MDLFRVKKEEAVNVLEMALPESLDSADFDELNQSLLGLLGTNEKVGWVIDLSAVQYMGSAMLGLMVNFRQQVKARNSKLALCGISPRLLEVIKTCCMDRLFIISKNRAEAVKAAK
jgi:anti-anti-sigma factor